MLKTISFVAFCSLFLSLMAPQTEALICDGEETRKCPFFNNVGIGGSNLPGTNEIVARTVNLNKMDFTLAFDTPFCRQCGYIFSYYPISYDEGHQNGFPVDGTTTSLDQSANPTWDQLWNTGNSHCDPAYVSTPSPMYADSDMMYVQPSKTCETTRIMKGTTYEERRDLVMPSGEKAYEEEITPTYLEQKTRIYAQIVFPYSLSTPAEKYGTRRSTFSVVYRYELQSVLSTNALVVNQREIIVKVVDGNHLQADIQLKLDLPYYWMEGTCRVEKSPWGMNVEHMKVENGNLATIKMLGSESATRYVGEILFSCGVQSCPADSACSAETRYTFKVEVDQSVPTEIVSTTKFNPTFQQYVSDDPQNPFETPVQYATSDSHTVAIAIGQKEFIDGYGSVIQGMKMCSGSCGGNPEYAFNLLRSGNVNFAEEQDVINRLGFKIYDNLSMKSFHLGRSLTGAAPLGFSFDFEALKTLNYPTWAFEISLLFVPNSVAKSEGIERTLVIRGESVDTEDTFVVKSFELLPRSSSPEIVPDLATSSSTTDKLVAVLVPSIAGGICMLCMFSIVALIGLAILVGIIRKSSKGSNVKTIHHNRMDDNVSVPSDSDLDLRNHAV